jgi:hypothetical protein
MDESKTVVAPEVRCERLGELAAQAAPEQDCAPVARDWAIIEEKLDASMRGARGVRQGLGALAAVWNFLSPRRWPVWAMSAAVLIALGGWLFVGRPLDYRLDGCLVARDGSFSTTSKRGTVTFDDGSTIALDRGSRFRLQRQQRGAELDLDSGSATLAVVHRSGARWQVLAGPFRVEVTGTRFDVAWSAAHDHFTIRMHEGEVRISGGMLTKPVYLSAGQMLESDVVRGSVTITDNLQVAPDVEPEPTIAPAAPAAPVAPTSVSASVPSRVAGPTDLPAKSTPRKRTLARAEAQAIGNSKPSRDEDTGLARPEDEPAEAEMPALSPRVGASSVFSEPDDQPRPPKSSVQSVVFESDGRLSGPIAGFSWVSGGKGTTFTAPRMNQEWARLRPADGQLCASGRVAGVRCVNENMPSMRCNWQSDWGVSIGWYVREDKGAWGGGASRGMSVNFRGRSSSYRLTAHRKGDAYGKFYCIENYKSGQVVNPSMFKTECWDRQDESLPDFSDVDYFSVHFPSGSEYVAFRYCVSGITFYP